MLNGKNLIPPDKHKVLRVFLLLFVFFGMTAFEGIGCSGPATVQLENVPVSILNGDLSITNNTPETWTNIRLTLNSSFDYSLKEVLPQQTVLIPAKSFTRNGESLDPASLGSGSRLDLSVNLPNSREGKFVTFWHGQE